MARKRNQDRRTAAIDRAYALVTEAMDLLDAHGGPADAAAHLELARHGLLNALKTPIE